MKKKKKIPKKKKKSLKKKNTKQNQTGKKKIFRFFFGTENGHQSKKTLSDHTTPCPSGAEQSLHPDVLKDHHLRHGVVVVLHDPCFATPGAMDGWLAGYDGMAPAMMAWDGWDMAPAMMGMMREICFFFCENGHKLVPGFRFLSFCFRFCCSILVSFRITGKFQGNMGLRHTHKGWPQGCWRSESTELI